jgi:hypothetical protein
MTRWIVTLLSAAALVSCRSYQYESKLVDQDGKVPPDQYARYGADQAEAIAIAREYGRAAHGDSPAALTKQAEAAMSYARTLPGVADITADPLGYRLTIRFKSGWRLGVPPIDDGKSGGETPGIASRPAATKQ